MLENIFEKFQSGFRANHSTETALLQVTNDLLIAEDAGECSVLILLDLTAAFDTVDHTSFINKLKTWFEVLRRALDWFVSYLSNRSFVVSVGDEVSHCSEMYCGVPQGSLLGPVIFSI